MREHFILWHFFKSNKLSERHHKFTQNLKMIGVWVISLIKCLIFNFLINMELPPHTCFSTLPTHSCFSQHPPSSSSLSIMLPVNRKLFHPHTFVSLIILFNGTCLLTTTMSGRLSIQRSQSFIRNRLWYHYWIINFFGGHYKGAFYTMIFI